MNVQYKHKKTKCPCCGSKEIFTLGLDQLCLDCPWENSLLLVQLGQMDHPKLAALEQFVLPITFESLKQREENHLASA